MELLTLLQVTSAPALEGPDATPIQPETPAIADQPELQETVAPQTDEEVDRETQTEVKAFMKWANKGKRARLFEFKSLDPIVGDALNRCAFDGDLDTARALAKAYLT
jgi:hypothetical protein